VLMDRPIRNPTSKKIKLKKSNLHVSVNDYMQ